MSAILFFARVSSSPSSKSKIRSYHFDGCSYAGLACCGGFEKAFGAKPGSSGVTIAGESIGATPDSGDLALGDVGGLASSLGRCGVAGARPFVLPGMFAVGGGGSPV